MFQTTWELFSMEAGFFSPSSSCFLMECYDSSQTGRALCSCLLLTPKGPETWVSSPVFMSLGMAPWHCRTGFRP